MCVHNVNANCFFCKSARESQSSWTYSETFDTIKLEVLEGKCTIDSCHIVILFNAIESTSDNPLLKDLDCRLTIVNKEDGTAKKITDFKYNPSENIIEKVGSNLCKSYSSQRNVVHVTNLTLPGRRGEYFLKLWIKDADIWKIQCITLLHVI